MKRVLMVLLLGLTACGGEEEPLQFPGASGRLAEYLPLRAGASYLYRRDADPLQTASLTLSDAGGGLLLAELDSTDLRIALLLRSLGERVEVVRLERGAVRLDLEPALTALASPLREGAAYSGSTRIRVLGRQFGINLLGVTRAFGAQDVLGRSYPDTYSVEVSVQTDLLGRSRVELELARGIGPVAARLVSPAVEMLGLEGVELRLELMEGP